MNAITFLPLNTVFGAFETCFMNALAFLQSNGISLSVGEQTFNVTFFDIAVSFSFLCFFFMLCFPHFYYEDDDQEL